MEVGAVKQAFNNEVILLKKKVNQAKVQIIHKLTRKAKTLTEKKAPEHLKEKLKKKGESAVKEVLILKKIKARDIAKFMITHTGEVKDYLNKPNVDNNKACARLILHKALQDKYQFFRSRFGNIPIKDLFMSRQERRKLKKEAKEEQKNKKKKGKVNEDGWNVESVNNNMNIDNDGESIADSDNEDTQIDDHKEHSDKKAKQKHSKQKESEPEDSESENSEQEVSEQENSEQENSKQENSDQENSEQGNSEQENSVQGNSEQENSDQENSEQENSVQENSDQEQSEPENSNGEQSDPENSDQDHSDQEIDDDDQKPAGKFVKLTPQVKKPVEKPKTAKNIQSVPKFEVTTPKLQIKKDKKVKDNKNKNLNEKLQTRKFKKDSELNTEGCKVIDPFFITETGENYLSLAEPRAPDEIKEIHKQGNRRERRAAMFGYDNFKPRKNNYRQNNFNSQRDNDNGNNSFRNNKFNDSKFVDRKTGFNSQRDNDNGNNSFRNNNKFKDSKFDDRKFGNNKHFNEKFNKNDNIKPKEEKLHPSWEAKKKLSSILPFQGKKIIFNES